MEGFARKYENLNGRVKATAWSLPDSSTWITTQDPTGGEWAPVRYAKGQPHGRSLLTVMSEEAQGPEQRRGRPGQAASNLAKVKLFLSLSPTTDAWRPGTIAEVDDESCR